jgi:hypothetical protein
MNLRNTWNEAFEQFDEETFFARLEEKVKPKPYYHQYRSFKDLLNVLSYLFAVVSILTAMYAVFWLFEWIAGSKLLGIAVAVVILFFLEKLKRYSSGEFWQIFYFKKKIAAGWLSLSIFIGVLCIVSSMFGTKQATNNLAPTADLLEYDSTATAYRAQVAKLEKENAEFATQRNHEGIIYHRIQSLIDKNKKAINKYQTRILALDKKLEGKNDLLSNQYQSKVEQTGWILAAISLLFELLFEACIAYIWYYYYRSYVERNQPSNQSKKQTPYTAPETPEIIPFSENKIGFEYNAKQLRNNSETTQKQRPETTRNNPPKQRETTTTGTTEQLVAQATQPETTHRETVAKQRTETTEKQLRNNDQKQRETIRETIIVSTPSEDISKLRKYAGIYYKRSIKKTSDLSTRQTNRNKYLEFRELLEVTGKFRFTETEEKLVIEEIG